MTILHHSGICVADIDAALRFYRDGIGLDVLTDKVIEADLESLLGVHTRSVRTVVGMRSRVKVLASNTGLVIASVTG